MPKQNYAVIRTHTIMMGDVSWHIVGFFVGFGSLYFFFMLYSRVNLLSSAHFDVLSSIRSSSIVRTWDP